MCLQGSDWTLDLPVEGTRPVCYTWRRRATGLPGTLAPWRSLSLSSWSFTTLPTRNIISVSWIYSCFYSSVFYPMCRLTNPLNVWTQRPYWIVLVLSWQHMHALDLFSCWLCVLRKSHPLDLGLCNMTSSKGCAFLHIPPCTGMLEALVFARNSPLWVHTSVIFCSCDAASFFPLPQGTCPLWWQLHHLALPVASQFCLAVLGSFPHEKPCWD